MLKFNLHMIDTENVGLPNLELNQKRVKNWVMIFSRATQRPEHIRRLYERSRLSIYSEYGQERQQADFLLVETLVTELCRCPERINSVVLYTRDLSLAAAIKRICHQRHKHYINVRNTHRIRS